MTSGLTGSGQISVLIYLKLCYIMALPADSIITGSETILTGSKPEIIGFANLIILLKITSLYRKGFRPIVLRLLNNGKNEAEK